MVDGRTGCVYFSFMLLFFKGESVWAAPAKAVTLEAFGNGWRSLCHHTIGICL